MSSNLVGTKASKTQEIPRITEYVFVYNLGQSHNIPFFALKVYQCVWLLFLCKFNIIINTTLWVSFVYVEPIRVRVHT